MLPVARCWTPVPSPRVRVPRALTNLPGTVGSQMTRHGEGEEGEKSHWMVGDRSGTHPVVPVPIRLDRTPLHRSRSRRVHATRFEQSPLCVLRVSASQFRRSRMARDRALDALSLLLGLHRALAGCAGFSQTNRQPMMRLDRTPLRRSRSRRVHATRFEQSPLGVLRVSASQFRRSRMAVDRALDVLSLLLGLRRAVRGTLARTT